MRPATTRTAARTGFAAGLALAALGAAPALADASYFDRFEGGWRGSGKVQRDVDPSPRSVTCSVEGARANANRLSIAGTCRAAVIFTRKIGADITYDPGSDRFTGTYTGSNTGPARLSGRLSGDRLILEITYAKAAYGDRKAVMTIANSGGSQFSMVVTDKIEGVDTQTSNISFNKR